MLLLLPLTLFGQGDLQKKTREFDKLVTSYMKDWSVPGLGVVVVKDNQVVYQKGLGVRNMESREPVDTKTLFACASTTKAMTAVCMGILVDEHKVSWNDPVRKYIPEFALSDPYLSNEVRIIDLFTHNTGIGNADFLVGNTNARASRDHASDVSRSGFLFLAIKLYISEHFLSGSW